MDTQEALEKLSNIDFESKETWEQDWSSDQAPEFHTDEVNSVLIKYHAQFTAGRNNLRILVPLCGKSLDMIWLADQGHSVVGVELIRKGIEAFLHDNKLTYTEESVALAAPENKATVFKATEKDITLFECSIFDFSSEVASGEFDCIWDRGSMTAIKMMKEGRLEQYTDIMLSCLKQDGQYFLEFFSPESPEEMQPSTFRFVSEDNLIDLFSERCNIRFLEKKKMEEDESHGSTEEHEGVSAAEGTEKQVLFMCYYYIMHFK